MKVKVYILQVSREGEWETVSVHHTQEEAFEQARWESQFGDDKLARVIDSEAEVTP